MFHLFASAFDGGFLDGEERPGALIERTSVCVFSLVYQRASVPGPLMNFKSFVSEDMSRSVRTSMEPERSAR